MKSRFVDLRAEVLEANRSLSAQGLAPFTFGNASAIDRAAGAVIIKPSGVAYRELTAENLVIVDMEGRVIEGDLRPSSDTATHLGLYRGFAAIGGIAHAHSHFATAWAQAGREIPCLGTTHADYFRGPIPLVDHLGAADVAGDYEANTGHAIVRRFAGIDPLLIPAALVSGHASFSWGATVAAAVENLAVLETVAHLAFDTLALNDAATPIPEHLLEKHFSRKHGAGAHYGQVDSRPGQRV